MSDVREPGAPARRLSGLASPASRAAGGTGHVGPGVSLNRTVRLRFTRQLHFRAAVTAYSACQWKNRYPGTTGVDIVRASILAAVPETNGGEPETLHSLQYDHIRMRLPTVGLRH
jgi:hypothetical protein